MYTTTVARALAREITTEEAADHFLYVVREENVFFYIGQSSNPLERFEQHLGRESQFSLGFPSRLGTLILENGPHSHTWTYELLRPSEAAAYTARFLEQPIAMRPAPTHPALEQRYLKDVEEDLIYALHPCLNSMGNRRASPLPAKYQKHQIVNINVRLTPLEERTGESGPGRPTRAEIDQAQRDLGEIRAYHQQYLDRRAGRGLATLTDQVLGQHQLALTRVIALLERVKSVEGQ